MEGGQIGKQKPAQESKKSQEQQKLERVFDEIGYRMQKDGIKQGLVLGETSAQTIWNYYQLKVITALEFTMIVDAIIECKDSENIKDTAFLDFIKKEFGELRGLIDKHEKNALKSSGVLKNPSDAVVQYEIIKNRGKAS